MCRVSQTKFLLDKYIAGLCFNRTAISIQKIGLKSSKSHLKSLPRIPSKSYRHKHYLKSILITFFYSSYKCLTSASTHESEYTLGSPGKIAHNGSHAEARDFTLAVAWSVSLPLSHLAKEKPEEADTRLWRVSASFGAAAPLGRAALFAIWQCCCFHAWRAELSTPT